MDCLFNSCDTYYKRPFGALPAGQTVHMALTIPENMGYVDPHLVLRKDGPAEDPVYYRMQFDGQTPGLNHFSVDVRVEDVGLYFYYFDLYTDFRRIFRGKMGEGVLSWQDGERWQLTVYDPDFETPDCVKGGVFYQIFPDRFCEAVENKHMPFSDRIYRADKHAEPFWQPNETGGHLNHDYFGGDLKGIQLKLPYLHQLGVTYIYLNPIFEAHSNHRYNTANYLNVDPLLGSNKDFEELCQAAARFGIRIILDGVFSHTGSDSLYFNKEGRYGSGGAYRDPNSPYRPWYDFSPQYNGGYRSWWGFDTLPEVNEEEPSYVEFITGEGGVIDTWLRRGAAGFRLDVADELPDDFIALFRQRLKELNPEALLLGEVWEDASNKEAYGIRRRYFVDGVLDSCMNYPYRTAILNYMKERDGGQGLKETVMSIVENYPPQVLSCNMNMLGTHDTPRILTALVDDFDGTWEEKSKRHLSRSQRDLALERLQMAAFLQYTLPGSPSLYYGDEAGMEGYKDPFNRRTYPWGREDRELLAFFQQLGQLRKGQEHLRLGDISFFEAGDGKLGFTRSVNGQTLRIYVNHSMDAWQVPVGRVLFGHHIHTLAPTWLSLSPMGFCVTREE